jgi:hypothetical protein
MVWLGNSPPVSKVLSPATNFFMEVMHYRILLESCVSAVGIGQPSVNRGVLQRKRRPVQSLTAGA